MADDDDLPPLGQLARRMRDMTGPGPAATATFNGSKEGSGNVLFAPAKTTPKGFSSLYAVWCKLNLKLESASQSLTV